MTIRVPGTSGIHWPVIFVGCENTRGSSAGMCTGPHVGTATAGCTVADVEGAGATREVLDGEGDAGGAEGVVPHPLTTSSGPTVRRLNVLRRIGFLDPGGP
ncbi:hypothetical protein [Amycolatopsis vastitatis]|uniref:hypothetical protein n=1 Tax=Amycolatopsis vastitatis TaxID=1905142 RepID=UPI00117853F8|nr:hypothetical protein [Amycolatopsis vastitatis]